MVAVLLGVIATVAAIRDGKATNLLIAAGLLAAWYAISRRHIFDSYKAGRRDRREAEVVDLDERRAARSR